MNKTELHKPYYPACVIALFIVLMFGISNICQLYLLKDNYPVSKLCVGSDYACIYLGTQHLRRTGTPYVKDFTLPPMLEHLAHQVIIDPNKEDSWYTYPPIPAYLNYPFVYFDMDTAARLMFFLLIAAVLSAYALINSFFQNIEDKDKKIIFLCGLITILLSYPFYFLIVRGHMVGIVILLLAMGIYLVQKNAPASGVCLGFSIGMLLYPALILVPLFFFRRYKIMLYTLLTLCLLFLCCPDLWLVFIKRKFFLYIEVRDWMPENCSLANTFLYFKIFFGKIMGLAGFQFRLTHYYEAALAAYALMFFVMTFADYKLRKKYGTLDVNIEIALILMYVPYMIAVPKVVFQYHLVMLILLIPALCSLTQILKKPMPQPIFWLFSCGMALSQIQAHSLQDLFQPKTDFFHFFPAFGLFLVMLGCLMFKLWFWRVYPLRMQATYS
jgi:hypothetical protein